MSCRRPRRGSFRSRPLSSLVEGNEPGTRRWRPQLGASYFRFLGHALGLLDRIGRPAGDRGGVDFTCSRKAGALQWRRELGPGPRLRRRLDFQAGDVGPRDEALLRPPTGRTREFGFAGVVKTGSSGDLRTGVGRSRRSRAVDLPALGMAQGGQGPDVPARHAQVRAETFLWSRGARPGVFLPRRPTCSCWSCSACCQSRRRSPGRSTHGDIGLDEGSARNFWSGLEVLDDGAHGHGPGRMFVPPPRRKTGRSRGRPRQLPPRGGRA